MALYKLILRYLLFLCLLLASCTSKPSSTSLPSTSTSSKASLLPTSTFALHPTSTHTAKPVLTPTGTQIPISQTLPTLAVALGNLPTVEVDHWFVASDYYYSSPTGNWLAIVRRYEVKENDPIRYDLNEIYLMQGLTLRYDLRYATGHGVGEVTPTGFTWTPDDHFLYFYHQGSADGSGQRFYEDLRRVDLSNGKVETISLSGWSALSPDGKYALGISSSSQGESKPTLSFQAWDLETGQSIVIPIPTTNLPKGYIASSIYGAPNGYLFAFTMADPYNLSPDQELFSYVVDLNQREAHMLDTPTGMHVVGFEPDSALQLMDQAGRIRIADSVTGKLIPPYPEVMGEAQRVLEQYLSANKSLFVRQVVPVGGSSNDRILFWVEFYLPESPNGGTSWYTFTLLRWNGAFQVMETVPDSSGYRDITVDMLVKEFPGQDAAGIFTALWDSYLESMHDPHLPPSDRLVKHSVDDVDPTLKGKNILKGAGVTGWVKFSVRPLQIYASPWVAGNGEIDGSWVNSKILFMTVSREGEIYHLKVLGTSP